MPLYIPFVTKATYQVSDKYKSKNLYPINNTVGGSLTIIHANGDFNVLSDNIEKQDSKFLFYFPFKGVFTKLEPQ